MLPKFGNGFAVFLLILATSGALARSFSDSGKFLNRLLGSKNGPVVVFLEPTLVQKNDRHRSKDKYDRNDRSSDVEDSSRSDSYKPQPGEEDAYLLYAVLRSTQETEELDAKADRTFEKTKDILRTAFAPRCQQRRSCEANCKKEQRQGCHNCQKMDWTGTTVPGLRCQWSSVDWGDGVPIKEHRTTSCGGQGCGGHQGFCSGHRCSTVNWGKDGRKFH